MEAAAMPQISDRERSAEPEVGFPSQRGEIL